MEARFLQTELETKMKEKVFLDSDDLRDLRQLMDHVRESKALILIQSAKVLERPYCLLELVAAIDAGVPIVGVALQGTNAYDFATSSRFLQHLDSYLDQVNPGACQILRDQGVEPIDVAHKLSTTLPNIISVQLNTSASRNLLSATMQDIVETLSSAKPVSSPIEKDVWLKARGEPGPLFPELTASSLGSSVGGSKTPSESSRFSGGGFSAAQSLALPDGAAQIRFAVAYSSDKDTDAAVSSAFRQLMRKLGRDAKASALIVNFSALHSAEAIAKKLRTLCGPDIPFVGAGSFGGTVVEGQWLSKEGYYLSMQAIHDPEGVYALFHATSDRAGVGGGLPINGVGTPNFTPLAPAEYQKFVEECSTSLGRTVKESVEKVLPAAVAAAEAKGLGRTPQLCLALSSCAYVEQAVEGLLEAVGERIPLAGGNVSAMGMAPPGSKFLFASASEADGIMVTGNEVMGGIAGFLSWPAVHVAGAFCTGLTPERNEGCVTAMEGPYTVSEIDGQPAWSVIRSWYTGFTDEDEATAIEGAKAGPMAPLFDAMGFSGKAFSMMEMIEMLKDDPTSAAVAKLNPLGVHLGTADGEDVHRVVTPVFINKETGAVSFLVQLKQGDKLSSMYGKRLDVRDRTARVAKQVVKNAGFDVDTVVGGFSFMCGMNYFLTGDTGMQTLAEKLGDALGWTPTLGMIGGPEFGAMADGKCAVGTYMYSTVVFSCVPVGVPFGEGTFATMAGKLSQQVSKSGTVLHAVDEDED